MPRPIDRKELQQLRTQGAQLIEVLPREEYEDQHLPGAIHLSLRLIESDAREQLDPARPVIVYCWDSA